MESNAKMDNGHLAQWTGAPAMFSSTGQKINTFTAESGHEFALSQVQACDEVHSKKVAGIVKFPEGTNQRKNVLPRHAQQFHERSEDKDHQAKGFSICKKSWRSETFIYTEPFLIRIGQHEEREKMIEQKRIQIQ